MCHQCSLHKIHRPLVCLSRQCQLALSGHHLQHRGSDHHKEGHNIFMLLKQDSQSLHSKWPPDSTWGHAQDAHNTPTYPTFVKCNFPHQWQNLWITLVTSATPQLNKQWWSKKFLTLRDCSREEGQLSIGIFQWCNVHQILNVKNIKISNHKRTDVIDILQMYDTLIK